MILGLEIYLVVVAWKKGWRAFSLLALGIGVLIGILCGAATGSIAAALLGDAIAICALGYMASHTPQHMRQPTTMAATS